jgi:P-type conjugative transfer protein TrbJ
MVSICQRFVRVAAASVLFTATTTSLDAGVPIGLPAQELTQILNYGQLVKQLITSAQQLQQAFAQVQMMVYNTKNLGQHPFTSIMGDLSALGNIVAQSQGMAYTMGALDKQFAVMYPSYDPRQQWYSQYSQWSASTLKTLNGTLASTGMQGANLMNDQQTLQQLRAMTATPMGQNQAAQIGAIASQEVVSQLLKLRQLMVPTRPKRRLLRALNSNRKMRPNRQK